MAMTWQVCKQDTRCAWLQLRQPEPSKQQTEGRTWAYPKVRVWSQLGANHEMVSQILVQKIPVPWGLENKTYAEWRWRSDGSLWAFIWPLANSCLEAILGTYLQNAVFCQRMSKAAACKDLKPSWALWYFSTAADNSTTSRVIWA